MRMSRSPAADETPRLDVEIVTLFPEIFDSFLTASLLGKAIAARIVRVSRTNPRTFGKGRHQKVDDAPYGGGPGMVMMPEPLASAIEHIEAARGPAHRVLLAPSGRPFDQSLAETFAARGRLLFICGRYEGIDERIVDLFTPEVVSIGDYVLAGGEMAAAVMIEATARLVPGVLGSEESTVDESFSASQSRGRSRATPGGAETREGVETLSGFSPPRLEYPQWTRPPSFRGLDVPQVLLSGNHAQVARWRKLESLRRTVARRPDLLLHHPLTDEEASLLDDGPPGGRKKKARK
jgi:tRNA (guanine37-N1)-methyltransferase